MKKFTAVISLSTLVLSSLFLLNSKAKEEVKYVEAGIPAGYYDSITSSMKGDGLKSALYNIIKGHTKYSYDSLEECMKVTDRDYEYDPIKPNEPSNYDPYVKLLYADYNASSNAQTWGSSLGSYNTTGKDVWNKEHIWAKSNGFDTKSLAAYSDLHHLRASDWKCNNLRSNYAFAVVSDHSSKNAADDWTQSRKTDNYRNTSSQTFEPRDSDKGDVARALFYMATRYYNGDGSGGTNLSLTNGTDASGGKWGYLDTLLAWHEADPVDTFESHRNDLIYSEYQHNRNPYIDHPEYARAVFKNEPIVEPDTLINLTYTGSPTKTSYKEDEAFNPNGLTVTATFQKSDSTTYNSIVTDSVSWSALTSSSTSVTGTYSHSGVDKQITVNGITVISLTGISLEGTLTKTVYEEGDTFDPTGLTLYADYSDHSRVDVTSSATWPTDPLEAGQLSVTVTYGGQELTFYGIHVKEKQVSGERIKFKENSSDGSTAMDKDGVPNEITSGADLVNISSAANVYPGKSGIKFSSGSKSGSITFTLKSSGYLSKLEICAKKYGSDGTTVTVSTNATSGGTFEPGTDLDVFEIAVNTSISSFTISSPSGQRFYLNYIDIYSGSAPAPSDDALTTWGEDYLFIGDSAFNGQGAGLCVTGNYYHAAKVALFALESETSGTINKLRTNSNYSAELARYTAWSKANHDSAPFVNDFSFLNNNDVSFRATNDSNTLIILVVALTTGMSFLTILLVIKKRRVR